MRKASVIQTLLIFLTATLLVGCGGIKKMAKNYELLGFKVQPEILEMHGDQVKLNINGTFPEKYFAKKAIVNITPVLKYNNGEKAFKTVTVQGESVQANNSAIKYKAGGAVNYNDVITYSDDMRNSQLVLKIVASQGTKTVNFPEIKIADGVVSTPRLMEIDPHSYLGSTKKINTSPSAYNPEESVFQRIVPDSRKADIHYQIQQAELRNSELTKEDIKALNAFLEQTKKDDKINLKNVEISSYASPDGAYELNDKLSGKRGTAAENYIKKEIKKKKITDVAIDSKATAEDWEGFKDLVKQSDIQDKDLILRVLSMYSDVTVREEQIKNMSATYKVLADKILPELRRSKVNVNVDLVGKSDEEILALSEINPDSLNRAEMLYAATLTNDQDRKLSIYKSFSRLFPDDWRGPNNEGYIYLEMNDISKAKAAFSSARKLDDNAYVLNNLGVCELHEGNFKQAEDLFMAALTAGKEVKYNLVMVNIRKGNYTEAVQNAGTYATFNVALAKMLAGDNNGALRVLEDKKESTAMDAYLKAVIGARTSNDDLLINSLKSAVNKDATLAGKAKTDLEFYKYFENGAFQSAVK
jgi:Flp pilus assembly protein TadD/outer membrane protein OmpA-like peptidoglycan-associated protein